MNGFLRAAAITVESSAGGVTRNKERIARALCDAREAGVEAAVFPRLALSGVGLGDVYGQTLFLKRCEEALSDLIAETEELDLVCGVGLPVSWDGRPVEAIAVFQSGTLLALVLPKGSEMPGLYPAKNAERTLREFAGFEYVDCGSSPVFETADGALISFGTENDLSTFDGAENERAAMGVAVRMIAAARPDVPGEESLRESLLRAASYGREAVVLASAGAGSPSGEVLYSGEQAISECGEILARSIPGEDVGVCAADIDVRAVLRNKRASAEDSHYGNLHVQLAPMLRERRVLMRVVDPAPLVPKTDEECERVLDLQARGLAARMRHIHAKTAVVGVSGGLDSTLALLVAIRAYYKLGLDPSGILAVTMPGFGTSSRTRQNAGSLGENGGLTYRTVDIREALKVHFKDIGLSEEDRSVAFENAQARERTQILMDLANMHGGLVVGTGDFSEVALGWSTFNGDHMAMYGVNATVSKTAARRLVRYEAGLQEDEEVRRALIDIVETPVSPELLPGKDGKIAQETEKIVGPYELHDFFLYHTLKDGDEPVRLLGLARAAFGERYSEREILSWMRVFFRRFFNGQFKRNCSPESAATGRLSLSPRGAWSMPSDMTGEEWILEIDALLENGEE